MSDLMLEIFVEMSVNKILSHIFLSQDFYEYGWLSNKKLYVIFLPVVKLLVSDIMI